VHRSPQLMQLDVPSALSRRKPGPTYATHDTELGGASPLRAARSGTASQGQLRRSDAGWGGSRRHKRGADEHCCPPCALTGTLIAGSRTASRTPTYCITNSAESGPDCGAAPGIAGNRPNQRASGRALKGPRHYGFTRRSVTRRWVARTRWRRVILRIGNHPEIDPNQSRGGQRDKCGSVALTCPYSTDGGAN
jgi:hypothetical protein